MHGQVSVEYTLLVAGAVLIAILVAANLVTIGSPVVSEVNAEFNRVAEAPQDVVAPSIRLVPGTVRVSAGTEVSIQAADDSNVQRLVVSILGEKNIQDTLEGPSPYLEFNFVPECNRSVCTYEITAKATDTYGNVATKYYELTVIVDKERNCSNNIDDDGDGLIDCQDPDCSSVPICTPSALLSVNVSGTTATLTCEGNAPAGLDSITLSVDGAVVRTCSRFPCTYSSVFSTGEHNGVCEVRDIFGAVATDSEVFTIAPSLPNLVALAGWTCPMDIYAGDKVEVIQNYENSGTVDADDYYTEINVDGKTACVIWKPGTPAGSGGIMRCAYYNATEGIHSFSVMLDFNNMVEESDESDNFNNDYFTVRPKPPNVKPNLKIKDIDVQPAYVYPDYNYLLCVSTDNDGNANAWDVAVKIQIVPSAPLLSSNFTVSVLPYPTPLNDSYCNYGGACIPAKLTSGVTYTITAIVDPDNVINEWNEADNVLTITYTP